MPPPLGNVLCEFDQRENGPRQLTIHLDEPNRLEYIHSSTLMILS